MDEDSGEKRMASALAAAVPAVWDWDATTDAFRASDSFRRLHELPLSDRITLDDFIACILEDDAGWARLLEKGVLLRPPDVVRYRVRSGSGIRWIRSSLTVACDATAQRIVSVTGLVEDVTEVAQATHRQMESEERLRLAIEAGRMAIWEVELKSGRLTQSPELNTLLGLPPAARPTLSDVRQLYAPGEIERLEKEGVTLEVVRDRSAHGDYLDREHASEVGDDRTQIQAEFSLITPAGVHKRLLLRAQYAPRPWDNPIVTGLLVDITEHAQSRDRLAVVARELRHRIKNTIAVVRALAAQTLRSHTDPQEGLDSYTARLEALALATDAIFAEEVEGTDLLSLAEKMTSPYRTAGDANILIEGEPIPLSAKQASALGMILHEFSTNAVKYGGLSKPGGMVELSWRQVAEQKRTVIAWSEKGGPSVREPRRQGFGSRLVGALVTGDLQGTLEREYGAAGFRAVITIPSEH